MLGYPSMPPDAWSSDRRRGRAWSRPRRCSDPSRALALLADCCVLALLAGALVVVLMLHGCAYVTTDARECVIRAVVNTCEVSR